LEIPVSAFLEKGKHLFPLFFSRFLSFSPFSNSKKTTLRANEQDSKKHRSVFHQKSQVMQPSIFNQRAFPGINKKIEFCQFKQFRFYDSDSFCFRRVMLWKA
jgi:hypothetical protein